MVFPSWFWPSRGVFALLVAGSAAFEFWSGRPLGAFVSLAIGATVIAFWEEIAAFANSRFNRIIAVAILAFGAAVILASVASYFGFGVR